MFLVSCLVSRLWCVHSWRKIKRFRWFLFVFFSLSSPRCLMHSHITFTSCSVWCAHISRLKIHTPYRLIVDTINGKLNWLLIFLFYIIKRVAHAVIFPWVCSCMWIWGMVFMFQLNAEDLSIVCLCNFVRFQFLVFNFSRTKSNCHLKNHLSTGYT